jgi:hypothetical protein
MFYMEDQSDIYVERIPEATDERINWTVVRHPPLDQPTLTPEIVAGPFDRLEDALNAYVLASAGI